MIDPKYMELLLSRSEWRGDHLVYSHGRMTPGEGKTIAFYEDGTKYGRSVARLAYMLYHGLGLADIEGQFVCHVVHCDEANCILEDHLYLGDRSSNVLDEVEKGALNSQKLTYDDADEIRRLYATGRWTMDVLGEDYDVSHATISRIVRHKTFKERT